MGRGAPAPGVTSLPLQCIVQSYLQWLQDSDYNPNCRLCNIPLATRETTRLVCYGETCAPWGDQDRPSLVTGFQASLSIRTVRPPPHQAWEAGAPD